MESKKWKTLLLCCLACLFCLCAALFAAGCAEQDGDGEVTITGRPEGDTLELTDEQSTYTLGCTVSDALWSSSDTAVAEADGGVLTLKGEGATVITASKGEVSDSFVLYVVDARTDTATVTIGGKPEGDSVLLSEGSITLTATCSDGSAVAWLSRDPAVATVGQDGTVTLLSRGTAQIVAYKAGNAKVCDVYLLRVVGESVTAVSIEGLPASGNLGIGKTIPLVAQGTPADCEPFETEWKIAAGGDYATIDAEGNLTGVAEGEVTVTATVKGTEISDEVTVSVIGLRENYEDFENAVIIGNYIVGSIECCDVNDALQPYLLDDGRLQLYQASSPASGTLPNYFDIVFTGLEVGKAYVLSFDMQVVEGYHFAQINVYQNAQGRFMSSAGTGTETQWGGNYLTINGEAYTDTYMLGSGRAENNTFAGMFIAGERTVTFRLVCNNVYKAKLDNIFLSDAPEATGLKIVSPLESGRIAVGDRAQFTASGTPAGTAPFTTEWSVSGDAATIAADGTLTAVREGTVTVTAKMAGKEIYDTVEITVVAPVASALYEDFEGGYLNGSKWSGAWNMVNESGTISFETRTDGDHGNVLYAGCTLTGGYNDMTFTVTGLEEGQEYIFAFDLYLLTGRFDGQINVYQDGQGRFGTVNDGTLTQWGGGNLTINGGKYTTSYPKQQWNTFAGTFVAAGESATFVLCEGHYAYGILLDNLTIRTPGQAEQITINAPDTIGIGDEVQLTVTPYPADAGTGNVVWSIAAGTAATVSAEGVLTGVSAGEVTVRAAIEGTNVSDEFDVTVVTPVEPGLAEDFEEGYLSGGTWHGAWTLTADSAIALATSEESGNTRLQATCTTTGYNLLTWTVTGLTVGQEYILSYDMQVLNGYHFSQINVYKDGQGRFMGSAADGTETQWGGNSLTINGGAYTDAFVTGDDRFTNATYAGTFVAGSETVVFLFVCSAQPYTIALDNMSVSQPSAVQDITIDVPNGTQVAVGDDLTLTATGSPANCLPFEVEWAITEGGDYATLDGNVLAGKGIGTVTVTATVSGTEISKTVTIEIVSPVEPGLAEDFEEGYLSDDTWHGAWTLTADSVIVLAMSEESGNTRLQATCTATGYNLLTWTVTGLTVGQEYVLSYDMQVLSGYHFSQINVYVDGDGRFTESETSGTLTQWGGNNLTINGGAYTDDFVMGDDRFTTNATYAGTFVAGSETVVFLFVCSDQPYTIALDNMSVSPRPAVESISIDTADNAELPANSKLTLTATGSPVHCLSFEVEWAIAEGSEHATLDGNVLTGVSAGEVTVTATVKGTQITDSVTIVVTQPAVAVSEDFENGSLQDGIYTGDGWTVAEGNAATISLAEEGDNTRLQVTATKGNTIVWTVTGLEVGQEYTVSYKMRISADDLNYHHFNQINVYVNESGQYTDGASGTLTQWGGNALTVDGTTPYAQYDSTGAARFGAHTFTADFVAGSETVVFTFVGSGDHSCIYYLDDLSVTPVTA